MENKCPFWQDYDSVNGRVTYCELAAFNKPVSPEFLAKIGCSEEKRKQCLEAMKLNTGMGAVPAPLPAPTVCDPPPEIAKTAVSVAEKKVRLASPSLQLLALLAGAYIAIGAILFTVVTNDLSAFLGDGISRLVGGVAFSLGLVLVVLGGAELFTGNNLIVTGWLEKKVTFKQLARNWFWVYLFNFIGSVAIALLFLYTGIWKANGGAIALRAINISAAKVSLPWVEALCRGILCNWLVCLAIWLSFAGKDGVSKILGIVFPIAAFVAIGFEHSVANMYFIPMGIFLKNQAVVQGSVAPAVIQGLTWLRFVWNNLVPVTIGNIIGGAIFVGTVYWSAYLRRTLPKPAKVQKLEKSVSKGA